MAYNYPALRLDLVYLNFSAVRLNALPPFSVCLHRRQQHQVVRLHLISHSVTASPRGEASCSLRPGGEGGATRRMRESLTVRAHEIRRIGGMRACRPTPRIETPRRAVCPHTAAKNKPPIRTAQIHYILKLYDYVFCFIAVFSLCCGIALFANNKKHRY